MTNEKIHNEFRFIDYKKARKNLNKKESRGRHPVTDELSLEEHVLEVEEWVGCEIRFWSPVPQH